MRKVVMGLSGGMDSATLLGMELSKGAEVHACQFYYGSKHGVYEKAAAEKVVQYYQEQGFKVTLHPIDIEKVFNDFQSNLLQSGGDIPEGHYKAENMKKTVVPARNMIFASIMAGLAESTEADTVALGVHSGDHHIYPDCRKEFVKSLDTTIYLGSDRKVNVTAPLIDMDKAEILQIGYSLNPIVPYHLTRTCYKDQEKSCGKCGSCVERLEAFKQINKKDPIHYE